MRKLTTVHDDQPTLEVRCPECGLMKVWKDGCRHTVNGRVQRYICRSCGFRFSDPSRRSFGISERPSDCRELIYSWKSWTGERRVGASESEAKNLVEVASRKMETAAGATPKELDIKGLLATYGVKLIQRGLKERTIKNRISVLRLLTKRGVDLLDPIKVWHAIDKMRKYNFITRELLDEEWTNGAKNNAMRAYIDFTNVGHIHVSEELNFQKYSNRSRKLPFIPLESEIDALIAGSSRKVSCFLQLLKETWMRAGEAWKLEWTDIDCGRNVVTVNKPEKHGLPRQIKASNKLLSMLNRLPKESQKIFGDGLLCYFRKTFMKQRKRIAIKLENPRIMRITFHTFRHWGATMEYHRTKDILHVKHLLGYRSIDSTMIYTHLVSFESDEFHVRVSKSIKEDEELIEAGFEYITERDGMKLYRKRK